MPLPISTQGRVLKHTRAIHIEAYARDDGLWDLDAHISDVKTSDFELSGQVFPAGMALHDLSLRITIDKHMNIIDVLASSDAVPYFGVCNQVGSIYQQLIGLNLLQHFRINANAKLAGVKGCTHLTELVHILPSAAFQALEGEIMMENQSNQDAVEQRPFQLNRCHALRLDGPVVAKYYPRWAIVPLNADSSS